MYRVYFEVEQNSIFGSRYTMFKMLSDFFILFFMFLYDRFFFSLPIRSYRKVYNILETGSVRTFFILNWIHFMSVWMYVKCNSYLIVTKFSTNVILLKRRSGRKMPYLLWVEWYSFKIRHISLLKVEISIRSSSNLH